MLGEVDDGRRVGRRFRLEDEDAARLDPVAADRLEAAGIALVAVGARDRQLDAPFVVADEAPGALAEAGEAAVEMGAAVLVQRELMGPMRLA